MQTVYGHRRWLYLAILFLVTTSNYVDRQIVGILLEPIKREFGVSDTVLGLLTGFSFAIFYATLGIPVARYADRGDRRLLISLSLLVWSFFTFVSGFAQQFWHLVVARIGVGAGEAGAVPPAQSLVAAYFPARERGIAFGILMMSGTAGSLIAFIGGAFIAENWGWRAAFLAMGAPGILLAAVAFMGLDEPRRPMEHQAEPLARSFAALLSKPGFRALTAAMILYFVVSYGAVTFLSPMMVRVYGVSLSAIAASYGVAAAFGTTIGSIAGGWITDRLARRDPRWVPWSGAVVLLCAAPVYLIMLAMPSLAGFAAVGLIANILFAAAVPPFFAHLHAICGGARRATAVALIFFFANLIGLGLGPLLTGALSDAFSAHLGPGGIRPALMIAVVAFLPSGWFMIRAGVTLHADMED